MVSLTVALLLAASAAHAAFQLTVTMLVYPALVATPAESWTPTHDAHARRITPVVAVVYLLLALACANAAWRLVSAASARPADLMATPQDVVVSAGVVLALLGAAGAAVTTAFGAAPTHGRLSQGRTEALLARLVVYDRHRCAWAVLGAVGALMAVCAGPAGPFGR